MNPLIATGVICLALTLLLMVVARRMALRMGMVGLLVGGIAAATVWFLNPRPYTAFALLRVASADPQRIQEAALVAKPRILDAALRQEAVRNLKSIRLNPNPSTWLEDNLTVRFISGTDLMLISLSGSDPEESAVLANAVAVANKEHLQEVMHVQLNQITVVAGAEVPTRRSIRPQADWAAATGLVGLLLGAVGVVICQEQFARRARPT
jgi:hypothetical protein